MAGLIYAIVTVLAWGTWLAPSQNVPLKSQQVRTFYVTLAVLLLALSVALAGGVGTLTARSFWLPFLGGIIWAASGARSSAQTAWAWPRPSVSGLH